MAYVCRGLVICYDAKQQNQANKRDERNVGSEGNDQKGEERCGPQIRLRDRCPLDDEDYCQARES